MNKVYYRIRRTDFDPKLVQSKVEKSNDKTGYSNYFETLEAAQVAAFEWAAKYQRSYTVVRLEEMGTAAPSAPPIIWTAAPAAEDLRVGLYVRHSFAPNGSAPCWKITRVREDGNYDVVSDSGEVGIIRSGDHHWSFV